MRICLSNRSMLKDFTCLAIAALTCLSAADNLPRVDLHAHIDGERPRTNASSLPRRWRSPENWAFAWASWARAAAPERFTMTGRLLLSSTRWQANPSGAASRSTASSGSGASRKRIGTNWTTSPRTRSSSPVPDGKGIWLWLPGVEFPDEQDFMNRYVEHNIRVISQPIQVWANPTYLPASLQPRYDALWTEARMDRVIRAAVKNGVAIEINAHFQIPSARFINARKPPARGSPLALTGTSKVSGRLITACVWPGNVG